MANPSFSYVLPGFYVGTVLASRDFRKDILRTLYVKSDLFN